MPNMRQIAVITAVHSCNVTYLTRRQRIDKGIVAYDNGSLTGALHYGSSSTTLFLVTMVQASISRISSRDAVHLGLLEGVAQQVTQVSEHQL